METAGRALVLPAHPSPNNMTNRQFQFVPDGDDYHEVEPRLTLVPFIHAGDSNGHASGPNPERQIVLYMHEEEPPPPKIPVGWLSGLLFEIGAFLDKYIAFPKRVQPLVLALWVVHTYLFEAAEFTPYIDIHAAEKRCGKSRLMDCLQMVARNPYRMDSPSPAAIYSAADNKCPTLLIDEVDTIIGGNGGKRSEALRGALDAGFERGGKVTRFSSKKGEPVREYDVYCPKVLAGIGNRPHTIADRSIPIRLERRATETRLPRFRKEDVKLEVAPLTEVLAKLHDTPELLALLKPVRPSVPDELSDRQKDISEPLLAIADLAGKGWGAIAREALVELFTADQGGEESLGVTLLTDIQTVFGREIKLTTVNLLKGLIALETGSPWAEKWESKMRSGQVSTCANQIAGFLKPYKIAPKQIRFSSSENVKGYERVAFTDVWARYCLGSEQEDVTATPAEEPTPEPAKPDRRRAAHRKQRNTGSFSNMFRRFPGNSRPSSTSD